jgi:anti-sigma regulatory factor (Ser/Thr protein kinase)
MAIVEVSFSALPVHVRTARMIVTAVARRSGVDEALLDEVRLAVGEACSRAVEAHQQHCPAEPVRLQMNDADRRFEVTVTDTAPADADLEASGNGVVPVPAAPADAQTWDAGLLGEVDPDLGLAVIAGLADDVVISSTPKGVEIRMSWPTVPVEAPSL